MKNIKLIKSLTAMFVLLFGFAALFTGCSKDDAAGGSAVTEGVIFRFERRAIYKTGVNEIGSVKITLMKGTEKVILPSSPLSGGEDQVFTNPFSLPVGEYSITGYIAYDRGQNYLFEIDLTTDDENVKTSFTVEPSTVVTFPVPVKTREVLNQNFIRNALMGLCLEVFGEDQSVWPWDPKKYPYPDWEGLEFEVDDYGNPMYISGIYFAGLKDGEPTPWVQMTALPDGTVSRISTITNLTFTDLPNLRALPSDLNKMPELYGLTLVDTGIETLPETLGGFKALQSLTVVNGSLKEVPQGVDKLVELRVLHLRGNQLARFDTPLGNLTKLQSVDLSNNPLESIGDGVFTVDAKFSELVLTGTKLSSLPANLGQRSLLRGVYLTDSQFTSVPSALRNHTGLLTLYLGGNPMTSVSASDFAGITKLETLSLRGIQFGTLPRLNIPKLILLDLLGCGLTTAPDLSGLPELRSLYLGANKFSTLPANYFINNPLMRILNLSNSPQLTTFGSPDLGLKAKISETVDGFKWIEVENCPSLRWVTPAAWQCFDGRENTNPGTQLVPRVETRRPDIDPTVPINPYFGRVAVKRNGSSQVTFGK